LTLVAVFKAHWQQKMVPQIILSLIAFVCCGILIFYTVAKLPNFWYATPLLGGMAFGLLLYRLQARKSLRELDTQLVMD
jgi:hypothetical protein